MEAGPASSLHPTQLPQTLAKEDMGCQGEVGVGYLPFFLTQLATPAGAHRSLPTPSWPPFPLLQCGRGTGSAGPILIFCVPGLWRADCLRLDSLVCLNPIGGLGSCRTPVPGTDLQLSSMVWLSKPFACLLGTGQITREGVMPSKAFTAH